MGLQKRQDNVKYYSMYGGNWRHKIKSEDGRVEYDEAPVYSGELTGIRVVDGVYDGRPTHKVELRVEDGQEVGLLQVNAYSWGAISLFRRFANVTDWSGTFDFGVNGSEGNEKVNFIWLRRNGTKVEGNNDAVPAPIKAKINGQNTNDYTASTEVIDRMVADISQKLEKLGHKPYDPKAKAEPVQPKENTEVEDW